MKIHVILAKKNYPVLGTRRACPSLRTSLSRLSFSYGCSSRFARIVGSTCVSVRLKGKENSYVSSGLDSQFLMYALQKQGFLVLGKG